MDYEQMIEELSKGCSPLEVSILKWDDIIHRNGVDNGSTNCALCYTYHNRYEDEYNDNCTKCPVLLQTRENDCLRTPYNTWCIHQRKTHGYLGVVRVRCTTCRELAQAELDFLISLRPKEQ